MNFNDFKLYMKRMQNSTAGKYYIPELLVYVVVWGIILLFPLVNNFFELASGSTDAMCWKSVFMLWRDVLPFLVLFLLNNRLLAPRLLLKQRVKGYVVSAVLLTMLVMGVTSLFDAPFPKNREVTRREVRDKRPFHHPRPDFLHPPGRDELIFIPLMRGPFFGRMLIALLMLSFNVAVKLFFKSLRDKEKMKELERHNLQSELDYLKYQINPHFFMNTLNNIHALVDINTEKAKQTIVELSKLMRYMLYEADKHTILLEKEVQFLFHYTELMRIRYPECVSIDLSLPEDTSGIQVPPLLFISFVENAFKHGVSYRKPSYISIGLEVGEQEVVFRCSNSRFGKSGDRHHGIGLENIRKRLQLLFGDRYTLSINETEQSFDVLLSVPVNEYVFLKR